MKHRFFASHLLLTLFMLLGMLSVSTAHAGSMNNPCAANPCAGKMMNPCAANPCAGKMMNPCAANPCAGKMMNPCAANPCAGKMMNPCAANPCAGKMMNPCAAKAIQRPANYKPYVAWKGKLVRTGKAMYNDTGLSSNGMACATCHDGGAMFQESFLKPYPHHVEMAQDKFAINTIHLDEMVQLCMMVPMATKTLPWDSKELASLVAYVQRVQRTFIKEEAAQ